MSRKKHLGPFDLDAYAAFQDSYYDESDRAVAILASSFLECVLEEALRERLVEAKEVDQLFDAFAPLSTFSGKIKVAFAVGLLSKRIYHDVNLVRSIRNAFAHDVDKLQFSTEVISKLCDKFHISRDSMGDRWTTDHRRQFLFAVHLIVLHFKVMRDDGRLLRLSIPPGGFTKVSEKGDRTGSDAQ